LIPQRPLRPVHTGNFVAIFGNNLLPICCRFPQQFVAVFGNKLGQQFVSVFQFVASVDRPLQNISNFLTSIPTNADTMETG